MHTLVHAYTHSTDTQTQGHTVGSAFPQILSSEKSEAIFGIK